MSIRCHSPTLCDRHPPLSQLQHQHQQQQQQGLILVPSYSSKSPLSSSPPASTMTNDTKDSNVFVQLKFDNFVELQTRLVLLPRVEEEGIGAVVVACDKGDDGNTTPTTTKVGNNTPTQEESKEQRQQQRQQRTAERSQETRDDDDDHDKKTKLPASQTSKAKDNSVVGCTLIGLDSRRDEDWRTKDFTEILALLRQEESTPLVLLFEPPSTEKTEVSSPTLESSSNSSESKERLKKLTSQESLQAGMSVLSSWGIRMRAQATEAASNLSTVAIERAKTFQTPTKPTNASESNVRGCDVFIQTSVGAFVPVAKSQSKVTTSSLLLVRKSATEPAPKSGWSFQWYRYSFPNESTWADDTASLVSGATGGSQSESTSSSGRATPEASAPIAREGMEWVPLEGATNAAFQPDATLVGRKLRCIVTMEADGGEPASSDESSDGLEDVDLASVEATQEIVELPGVVVADATLFNAARQALARGAKFGGLQGRGNAQGRQLRVEVAIGMPCRTRSSRTTSSVLIYQVSGTESISLTPKPILHASAHVPCSSSPKHLDLKIAAPSNSMLSALCTDGALQLEFANRMARESFLMALGIANYTGQPAKLDAKTVLFKDEPIRATVDHEDDEVSVVSAGSGASSGGSQGSGRRKSLVSSPAAETLTSPIASVRTPGIPMQQSPPASLERPSTPQSVAEATTSTLEEENRVGALERELDFLRGKLVRKDKVVSELQREITKSDAAHEQTRQSLKQCQQDLQQSRAEQERLSQLLQKSDGYMKTFEAKTLRLEGDHAQKVGVLETRIASQNAKIADLEKANRSLQNEKAVSQAAVEARESKLTRMADLQTSFDELSTKVAQNDALRKELETVNRRYEEMKQNLHKVEAVENECRTELEATQTCMRELSTRMEQEREQSASCRSQLDTLQKKIQSLKGERNSYKQKNDSLSKEVARICKNGRTIKDIETILVEHQTLSEEVEVLRQQKRKAMEDAHQYRTFYQQSRAAQELAGTDGETQAALERTAELERLLAEMTEYVNAKEMQLDTYKQINEQLQNEIHSLAQANLGKDEI